MHLLTRYALTAGVKIDKQEIQADFFPLPCQKYITIHNQKKFESRRYEYFDEVILIIENVLMQRGYNIVHVGTSDEPNINGENIIDIRGKTTFNQLAYVIQNSSLHIGIDSLPAHLAGMFDIPFVGLYPNMYASQSRPFFGNKKKQVCIEPDRKGNKPSYSANEFPKTINNIKPEDVADSIFKLLDINVKSGIKSLFFGDSFKQPRLSIIPNTDNSAIEMMSLPDGAIASLRFDLNPDYKNTEKVFQIHSCGFIVYAKGNFPITLLKKYKKRIDRLVLEVTDATDEEHIKNIKSVFKNLTLITKDFSKSNFYQIKFFEHGVAFFNEKEIFDKLLDRIGKHDDSRFFSSSTVISNGSRYPSIYHAKNDIIEKGPFVFKESMVEDSENFYIFQIIKNHE